MAILKLTSALAVKLAPFSSPSLQELWQQTLVLPGPMFRRQKLELADILLLEVDCWLQLAVQSNAAVLLDRAVYTLQMAAALLKSGYVSSAGGWLACCWLACMCAWWQ